MKVEWIQGFRQNDAGGEDWATNDCFWDGVCIARVPQNEGSHLYWKDQTELLESAASLEAAQEIARRW